MDTTEERRINEVIGQIIREVRISRNVTQDDLAQAIGLSRTSVVNMENRKQGVTLETLYAIAFALDVSVRELLPMEPGDRTAWAELAAAQRRIRELEMKCERAAKILIP